MGLLSSIGDAVGGAIDAAADVVSDTVSGIADGDVGSIANAVAPGMFMVDDFVSAVGDNLGPIGDVVDGAMDILSAGSPGSMLNEGMDTLGLPDWIGDVGGGVLDFCSGNYVGATANGLDALEDVAKAAGEDEIAGFLKAGSQVTGMFAGGPGAIGGKVGQLIETAQDSVQMIDNGLGIANDFANGDYMSAGSGILGMVGDDLGPLTSHFDDLSDQALGAINQVVPNADQLLGSIGSALEDGELTIEDLDELPLGDLASQFDFQAPPGLQSAIAGPIQTLLSDVHPGAQDAFDSVADMLQPAQNFNESMFDAIKESLDGVGADAAALDAKKDTINDLLGVCMCNPVAADALSDLLEQVASIRADIDITHHHCSSLRA